jgi:hypothetical protein
MNSYGWWPTSFSKSCETPVSSKVICVLLIFIRKLTYSVNIGDIYASDEAGKVIDYQLCILCTYNQDSI